MSLIKRNKQEAIMFFFAFIIILFCSMTKVLDYDYWFHFFTGEYISYTGNIPTTAIGSWYGAENNLQWISHEWLFGYLIYHLTNLIGQSGVVIFCKVLISLGGSLALIYGIKKWTHQPLLFGIGTIVLATILCNYAVPRPQVLLYILTISLFWILLKEKEEPSNKTYLLIPLTILWVNLHGGSFMLIFVFLLALIIVDYINLDLGKIKFERADYQIQNRRLKVFLLCAASVIINPHGLEMYMYPIVNITDNLMISSILEWQPLNIRSAIGLVGIIIPILYICALIGTKKRISAFDMIVGFAFIYLELSSIRFIAQCALVLLMITPNYLDSLDFIKDKIKVKISNIIFGGFTLAFMIITVVYAIPVIQEPFVLSQFPSDEMIEKVKEEDPERLFNIYSDGGYLLYNNIDVFIDGRADIYSSYNLADYMDIIGVDTNIDELINEYNFDYLLIKNDSKLQYWINNRNDFAKSYELIFADDNTSLYKNLNFQEVTGND